MGFWSVCRRTAPWIVGLATVFYVFARVPIEDAWSVARGAHAELFVPLVLCAVVFWFLLESAAYARLFSRFNTPVTMHEARSMRALSYLLTPIHQSLGKLGIVMALSARKNVPALEASSTVALYQTLDVIVLAALTTIGLSIVPTTSISGELRLVALAVAISLSLYLLLIRLDRPRADWARNVRDWIFHTSHRRFDGADLRLILGVKLAYHGVMIAVFFFGARAFGVELPLWAAIATTPVIQTIGALPISPGGLGTQQAAMLFFFSGFGPEAAIVAFGFSLAAGVLGARCLLGLVYLLVLEGGVDLSRIDSAPRFGIQSSRR